MDSRHNIEKVEVGTFSGRQSYNVRCSCGETNLHATRQRAHEWIKRHLSEIR